MWNGAVFMPLIDEIETIDPGFRFRLISAATAWLMKNVVSRFAVNSARQSSRVTRDVDKPVEIAVGAPYLVDDGADALIGGCVGRHRYHRKSPRTERRDVLVEVLLGPTHRDDGRAGFGGHPRHRCADAAATGTGHHHNAAVEAQEVCHTLICPDNIRCSAY